MALFSRLSAIVLENIQVILVFFVIFMLLWKFVFSTKSKNLPPGIKSWPIVGSMPYLEARRMHKCLTEYSTTLGEIFHFYSGSNLSIVLSGYDCIKDAMATQGELFANRARSNISALITKNLGIVNSNGVIWKEHRRFALKTLRDFGMGKSILERRILEECGALCRDLDERAGASFDPQYLLCNAVSNVICSVVFGKRFEYDDTDFKSHIDLINENFSKNFQKLRLLRLCRLLKYAPGDPTRVNRILANQETIVSWIRKSVEEHRKNFDPSNINDFIDAYLKEMTIRKENDSDDSCFNDDMFARDVQDLFVAGTETTSTTLRWGLLYMITNPQVQKKVQEEIDDVLGQRPPSMQDRNQMPYTEATIHEIQRKACLLPISVPHATVADINFRGYSIPGNTQVIYNLDSVFFDPTLFPEPDLFKPERFLDETKSRVIRIEQLIPFGIGKRVCLGESMARMELFLFFTSLLQKYTFSFQDDSKRPESMEAKFGIVLQPRPFEICANKR